MQEAFGADVAVATAEIGLYLVVARREGPSLPRALSSVGARVAARISATRVLAVMRFASFELLRRDPAIRLVGPVALDPDRFEVFQRMMGLHVEAS